jgi:cell division protein FtsQ
VRVGRKQVVARAKRLARVYPKVLKRKEAAIKAIDLRYTNGFAVQWKRGKKSKTYAYGVKKRNG